MFRSKSKTDIQESLDRLMHISLVLQIIQILLDFSPNKRKKETEPRGVFLTEL